ncbi:MAG: Undecaprenyl-diphosphatase [Promethearchaeota archaeon]|nr:MAG: Undecaprenyl-diphosphatase [Candidatus Lokiarchaeota archaeon]
MIEYIIIAILQGLVEWLPISSSGQVIIVAVNFFGISVENAFSLAIWLHLGTMFAVLFKFRKEFLKLLKSLRFTKNDIEEIDIKKRNWLIIGTICTAITALPLYFIFKAFLINSFTAVQGDIITLIIAGLLVITGLILLQTRKQLGTKTILENDIKRLNKDSIIPGLAQGISILPGISRSGITISAILLKDYQEDEALHLSFLMSVPAILASIGVDIIFGGGSVFGTLDILTILIITVVSFIVGLFSMELLLQIAKKVNFSYFCIIYGILAFIIIIPFYVFS